jgi:imidazolonepropionase-like amidohydrolase
MDTARSSAHGAFAVRHARVFDGTCVLPYDTVVVRDGVVTAVGKAAAVLPEPEAADLDEVIDGTGRTLLPGLIDAHVHLGFDTSGQQARVRLRQALRFGVTTVLDMFSVVSGVQDVKREQASGGGHDLADLRSAGICATAPGGHGTEYGYPIPTLDCPEDAAPFVAARVAEGSDYIKIILDDARRYGSPDRALPTLDPSTLAAVVQAAHAHGKLVVAHVLELRWAREAIAAGVDGLAHIFVDTPADERFGPEVAARCAFVIPTLAVLESVFRLGGGAKLAADSRVVPFLEPDQASSLVAQMPFARSDWMTSEHYHEVCDSAVRQLKAAGVAILAGSDTPVPGTAPGASLHRELELLVHAGLSPAEALAAATAVPASVFGLADRGRIAPGQRADLVLVDGDPTREITQTRALVRVWKRGSAVDRETIAAPKHVS